MFDLLFDGKKISSYQQLKDNFDFETVKLYCLGGSLSSWLDCCGESEIAERVRGINIHEDIDIQLAEIFGLPAPIRVDIQKAQAVNNVKNALSSFVMGVNPLTYALTAGNSSFIGLTAKQFSSFEVGTGSFFANSGSFTNGSYTFMLGSFEQNTSYFEKTSSSFRIGIGSYEYESEYEYGSFRNVYSSFKFEQSSARSLSNSFNLENTSFSYNTGSFLTSSYFINTSSYNLSSFTDNSSISSFSSSSFIISSFSEKSFERSSNMTVSGCEDDAYGKAAVKEENPKTPEEKICDNLTFSPLNRYGYGIHLI